MIRSLSILTVICMLIAPLALAEETPVDSEADQKAAAQKTDAEDPAVAAIDAFIATQQIDRDQPDWKTKLAKPPQVTFDPARKYSWHLETSKGPIVVRLMPEVAPMHVSSTIYLTRLQFYDGTPFHRVIPGFMAQGGDPLGSGRGGPGYQYAGEYDPNVKHDRPGLLSMANTGQPSTDGSQFFLTFVPTPHLDGKHTILGEVVSGKDTLDKLEELGSRGGRTKEPLQITTATIHVE
jgi:peptidyl-prolyl cis-trans isomerase B (cyclophilin B)